MHINGSRIKSRLRPNGKRRSINFSPSRPASPILKNGSRNFTRFSESWLMRRQSFRSLAATLFRRRTHASEILRRARCFLTRCGMPRSFSSNNKKMYSSDLCGPLRISALKSHCNAETAEDRRGVRLSYEFCKQALRFFGRLDAEFGVQFFIHSFEVLLDGRGLALRGESSHRQPMHVLAKRITCQGFACVPQSIGPAFFGQAEFCESGHYTSELL